jgi:Flp pilus assembly protein TadD
VKEHLRLKRAALALTVIAAACGGRRLVPNPSLENAYRANNLGVALLEQFKYQEASAAFRQALGIEASLAIARVNLSLALLYSQDLQGAAREATEAARLLPSAPQPPYVLGLVARADNRSEDARGFFQRVRQIDPRDIGASVNLAQIDLQDRNYAEAISVLRPAVADEPYNLTAAYDLGLALTRAGQPSEGRQLLERSQALRTTGYAVTFGTTYLEQGRYAEALASTGAEPGLVDTTVPPAAFTPEPIGSVPRLAPPSPFGRSFPANELTTQGARAIAAGLGGGLTLIDFDRDGDLDLFVCSLAGQRLLRNDGHGVWVDVTRQSGLEGVRSEAVPVGCLAGDYDNDGLPDLFVLRYGGNSLYHNEGNGRFKDVTAAAGIPPYPFLPGAAALVDVDHDGDLDVVIAGLADPEATRQGAAGRMVAFPKEFAPAPVQLLRNNGNGTFTEITREAQVQVRTHAIAIVPTDFDNRRDIDLLIVNRDAPPLLFKNLRDGTFRDVASDVGLASAVGPNDEVSAVAAADINQDDFPDFFFARASGGVFALSDSRGRFTIAPAPDGTRGSVASQFVDYDNDGLLDLLTWSPEGPRVFRNLGQRWSDVTGAAVRGPRSATLSSRAVAVADVDADGNTDFITDSGSSLVFWRNRGAPGHRSLAVRLEGLVSNRLGVGSKIQLRAGSLSGRVETSAATPPVAPADVVFGLGRRAGADVVRVLWPSGILQAEAAAPPATLRSPLTVEELNRKPSSCPFLFTWNGERFEFVTDFMGGGEIGSWEAPGEYNRPHPIEYVRIRGDQLMPKNGRFDLRVTNELEETLFADRFQLIAVAHPRGIDVFPNEGMTDPPKPFRLYGVRDLRVPARAVDDRGHDVTDRIARLDRRYPDDFVLGPFRGFAAPHTLSLDLGTDLGTTARGDPSPMLLLTAWTDYAFSSDNVAGHQAGLSLSPPSLQIKDLRGTWRTAIADIGIPIGRPQTMVVDLAGHLRPGEREMRIVTNMRIYWDQILVGKPASIGALPVARIDPSVATLRARGFSAPVRPDGKEPESYDYARVSLLSPWKNMPGAYTREGDVRALLTRSEDMFVVAKPGDEIALEFDAGSLAPLPDTWTRTFLLLADGFSKEMDINSASPDVVEPLPFHRMTRYPYLAPERYPDTPEHRSYRNTYNTRVVSRSLPSLLVAGTTNQPH